jgi:hypothetical protein
MANWTPEQDALYRLQSDLSRDDLPMAGQREYVRLRQPPPNRPDNRQGQIPGTSWSRGLGLPGRCRW